MGLVHQRAQRSPSKVRSRKGSLFKGVTEAKGSICLRVSKSNEMRTEFATKKVKVCFRE